MDICHIPSTQPVKGKVQSVGVYCEEGERTGPFIITKVNLITNRHSIYRGIYSKRFAELGKGKKNQPLNKEGEKSARGTTIRKG